MSILIDNDPQHHVVDRLAGCSQTAGELGVACFGVGDLCIDFPEPIATRMDLHLDAAAMFELTLGRGGRQGHRERSQAVGLGGNPRRM